MRINWLQEGSCGAILWFGFVSLTAALNLVLDFERIDNLRRQSQADHIHWYVALGLMVTLVWLYVSILRLIANLRRSELIVPIAACVHEEAQVGSIGLVVD
jgi:uncharacterized YccA/Bax inhibitor family protein